jgi:hypothetical protein
MKKTILILSVSLLVGSLSFGQTGPYPWEMGHETDEESITETPVAPDNAVATENATSTAFLSEIQVVDDFSTVATPDSSTPTESGDTSTAVTPESSSESNQSSTSMASPQVGVDVGTGSISGNGFDADFYTFNIPYSHEYSDRMTLLFSLPVSMADVEGASFDNFKIYGSGLNAGFSYKVFTKADNVPYRWKVSPTAGLLYNEIHTENNPDSIRLITNCGFSSSFAYQLTPHWIINMGNSISLIWNDTHSGANPSLNKQQVLINGIQVFYLAGRWTYYGYVMDTRMLENDTSDYQTYALGVAFKLTKSRSMKVTLLHDNGADFHSTRMTVGSNWKF